MIVAGEESGDMRAASLVRSIKAYAPHVSFFGIAGERSRKEGVETFSDVTELAVIGFLEVIKHLPQIKKVFDYAVWKAKEEKPDLVILVDYPGFNLRLAREMKKLGIKVIYYVSPQVWAWKASRIKTIKACVDRMLVLFPFEADFYKKHGYTADFVGHPLVDEVRPNKRPDDFLNTLELSEKNPTLALLPGSREKEVSRLLPIMLKAANLLQKEHPRLQVLVLQARNINDQLFKRSLKRTDVKFKTTKDYYNALNAADLCVVASGTATLETGIMGKPMVVVYKTSWLTYFMVKAVIRIPYISLVNIVAGKKVVEELIQHGASAGKIARTISALLKDPQKAQAVRRELTVLKNRLGLPGASQRAAKIVISELNNK